MSISNHSIPSSFTATKLSATILHHRNQTPVQSVSTVVCCLRNPPVQGGSSGSCNGSQWSSAVGLSLKVNGDSLSSQIQAYYETLVSLKCEKGYRACRWAIHQIFH